MSSFSSPNQPGSDRPNESSPARSRDIAISGQRGDVVAALKKALEDPALASTLILGFREPVTSIKLIPHRPPNIAITVRQNEISVEYHDRLQETSEALHSIVKQLCARATVELLHKNMTSFVQHGTLPPESFQQVKPYVEGFNRSEVRTKQEAADIIRVIVEADSEYLLKKTEKITKKLHQTTHASPLSTDEASANIDTTGQLAAQLLAATILRLSDEPSADKIYREVFATIDKATTQLAHGVRSLWPKALYHGNGHTIIERYQQMRRAFLFSGVNAPVPDLISSERRPPVFQPLQGGLFNATSTPKAPRFHAAILRPLSTLVTDGIAAVEQDQALRSWSTTDPNPFGFLQERLLDTIRDVPAALNEVKANLPKQLPQPLTDLLQSICLLRLHGGPEGLAHFGSLACRFSDRERKELQKIQAAITQASEKSDDSTIAPLKERLQAFLAELTEQHSSDYQSLLEFLAKWPLCKTPDERAEIYTTNSEYLNGISISLLMTITNGLEDYFRRAVLEAHPIHDELLKQFLADAKGLAKAGADLGNPAISHYIAPITTSLQDLITAMRIRLMPQEEQRGQVPALREIWAREQEQLARLPSPLPLAAASVPSFTELVLSVTQSLMPPLEAALSKETDAVTARLQNAVAIGNFEEVAPAIREALECLRLLQGLDRYQPLVDLVNKRTISWINDIGSSLSKLGDAFSQQLRDEQTDRGVISDAIISLRWHLKLAHDLRDVFSKNEFPDRAIRINHINIVVQSARERISTALLADEHRFLRIITSMLDTLRSRPSPELLENAREIAAMPIVSSKLKTPRAAEVFENLRARVRQA
jgi:hypothetical protein